MKGIITTNDIFSVEIFAWHTWLKPRTRVMLKYHVFVDNTVWKEQVDGDETD